MDLTFYPNEQHIKEQTRPFHYSSKYCERCQINKEPDICRHRPVIVNYFHPRPNILNN